MSWGAALILMVALALLAPSVHARDNCSKRQLSAKSTVTLDLTEYASVVRAQPAFYFHDSERGYVFFVKPEDVVAWLGTRKSLANVLEMLKRDLPLKSDTDLFSYGLRVRGFEFDLQWMLADLLDSAHVMVDRLPIRGSTPDSAEFYDRQDPIRVKRMFWESRGGDGRRYCQESGLEILTIVETIYD